MFSTAQPTNPTTDYPVNLFEDESRDHANLWDSDALRASLTATARDESNAFPTTTALRE